MHRAQHSADCHNQPIPTSLLNFEEVRLGHLTRAAALWQRLRDLGASDQPLISFDVAFTASDEAAAQALSAALPQIRIGIVRQTWLGQQQLLGGTMPAAAWTESRFLQWVDHLVMVGRDSNCLFAHCAVNAALSGAFARSGRDLDTTVPVPTIGPPAWPVRMAVIALFLLILSGSCFVTLLSRRFVFLLPAPYAEVVWWTVPALLVGFALLLSNRRVDHYLRPHIHNALTRRLVARPMLVVLAAALAWVVSAGWIEAAGWRFGKKTQVQSAVIHVGRYRPGSRSLCQQPVTLSIASEPAQVCLTRSEAGSLQAGQRIRVTGKTTPFGLYIVDIEPQ